MASIRDFGVNTNGASRNRGCWRGIDAPNKSRLDELLAEQFTLPRESVALEAQWLELTEALKTT